ncbi:hypothetical protein [Chlorobaculum tepidum]|jgi:hypothetical protein|nr:hypothetical protein [Chlorobaculum tepidum]
MSLTKKLVVVLGSKPNADIPLGDAVYCANAAIGYYAEMVSRFPRVVSVMSPDVIHPKEFREGVPDRALNQRQFQMVLASRPEKMILTRTGHFEFLKETLAGAGFKSPMEAVSAQERRALVGKISGCYDPIVTSDFFRLPLDRKIRYAGSLASTFLKRLLNKRKDCGAVFRPSTGILALVFAIAEHGRTADYVICGIGVRKRNEYLSGKQVKGHDLPHHVFADVKVLRKLARRYNLFTTEPELEHLVPRYRSG